MSEKKIWEKPEILVLDVNENTEDGSGKDLMFGDDGQYNPAQGAAQS